MFLFLWVLQKTLLTIIIRSVHISGKKDANSKSQTCCFLPSNAIKFELILHLNSCDIFRFLKSTAHFPKITAGMRDKTKTMCHFQWSHSFTEQAVRPTLVYQRNTTSHRLDESIDSTTSFVMQAITRYDITWVVEAAAYAPQLGEASPAIRPLMADAFKATTRTIITYLVQPSMSSSDITTGDHHVLRHKRVR